MDAEDDDDMAPEIYWVRAATKGRLGIMTRPRAGDWLSDEVRGWSFAGVRAVVCLLEAAEIDALELHDERALCEAANVELVSFPIPDGGVPASLPQTAALVDGLVARMESGSSVAIHCRAGIGRSGLIAGCVLARLGVPVRDIFPIISRARGLPVPDTDKQVEWLARFARAFPQVPERE